LEVNGIHAEDDVHVKEVKADQAEHDNGRNAHEEPTVEFEVAGRPGSSGTELHVSFSSG
jgi:hypothetical protein